MNIVEAIARRALAQPQLPALIAGERVVSYAELMENVVAVASRLAQEGVARNDRVAIVAPGLVWHVVLTLAVAHLGAVSLPLEATPDPDTAALAQLCGVTFVVHNQPEGFRIAAPCIGSHLSVQHLAAQRAPTAATMVRVGPDELFRIALSSGTTGRPKAIAFTHGSMVVRIHLIRTVFPCGPGDRTMIALGIGLHFSVGYWLRSLVCGGAVVASARSAAMQTLREQRVTFLLTSAVNAIELVKVAQADPRHAGPPPDLVALCMGGSVVAPALQDLFRRHLCPNLFINYGITEAGGFVAQADASVLAADPASAGRVLPWVELEAVDPDGRPLPAGVTGLLRMRSPYLASGYIGATGAAAGAFRDGWFYSSDRGMVTADGLVYLGGRDDVLNLDGVKVPASRIEAVVAQDPAVLECVALTMPDHLGQAQLLVVVVAPQGVDGEALQARCLRALGAALVPAAVVLVDQLPHNAAGKVVRHEVAALVQRLAAAKAGAAPGGPGPAA